MTTGKKVGPRRRQVTTHDSARFAPYSRPALANESAPGTPIESIPNITGVARSVAGRLLGIDPELPTPPTPRNLRRIITHTKESTSEISYNTQASDGYQSEDDRSYDARSGEFTKGVVREEDLEKWTKPAAEFIRSTSGFPEDPDMWIGKRPLGEGGFGLAGLWEKVSAEGTLLETMVIKQIGPDKYGRWDPRVPQEVEIMNAMKAKNCRGTVQIKAYKRYPKESVHRIYMEYCPHGDLRRLYKKYRRFRQHLPEAFLWEVFYCLIEAAAAMNEGLERPGWDQDEIVHRDIKPGNIFLSEGNLTGIPFYPEAKLGDFGLAIDTSPYDPENPRRYVGAGTRDYMAPEQREYNGVRPSYLRGASGRLSGCTNIWAIGATMYELLTLHYVRQALYSTVTNEEGEGVRELYSDKQPEYSQLLRDLIRSCLRPDPQTRPEIADIQAIIQDGRRLTEENNFHLRGENKSIPHELERLYYIDKDIEKMPTGSFQPSQANAFEEDQPESGFPNPDYSAIRFPNWQASADLDDESSSDGEGASRMVLAGYIPGEKESSVTVRRGWGETTMKMVEAEMDEALKNDDEVNDDEMDIETMKDLFWDSE